MPSLNLLVVGDEKQLGDFEEALEGCKRYVGPIKLFSAHKAVDAVGRLQVRSRICDAETLVVGRSAREFSLKQNDMQHVRCLRCRNSCKLAVNATRRC